MTNISHLMAITLPQKSHPVIRVLDIGKLAVERAQDAINLSFPEFVELMDFIRVCVYEEP